MNSLRAHASNAATTLRVLGGAGVIRPYGPRTLVALGRTVVRWGTGPAGGFASLAVRNPDRVGLVDELGELTFGEMQRRSNALARGLAGLGVGEDPVTGSLNAGIAQWLAGEGEVPRRWTVTQGGCIGRAGVLALTADEGGEVRVGGAVTSLVEGTIRL